MKKNLLPSLFAAVIFFSVSSCKKPSTPPPPGPCVNLASLEYQWTDTYILEQSYSGSVSNITNASVVANPGYFQLNANSTYNVLSNGVADNGNWDINQTGCQLELDKGTANFRAFSILTLTSDSLIIKRTDSVNYIIYTQHYSK